MAAYLSPVCNDQICDSNGAPLSGGLIYTYQAGTTTAQATYTDSTGATPQANPIELNSSGRCASPIWLPAGQAVKLVVKTSGGVTVATYDNVTGVNDPSSSTSFDQWVTFASAPTFVSSTSFTIGGDQTGAFHVGRRVKSTNTGGTIYSTITASSYNSGTGRTTVTVANDSGSLDSGLSAVSYGLVSFANSSAPGRSVLAGTGYRVTADGFIEQWGSSTTSASADVTVSFPIAFPGSLFGFWPSAANSGGSSNATITTGAVSTSSANVGAYQGNTGSRVATAFYWRAIGK